MEKVQVIVRVHLLKDHILKRTKRICFEDLKFQTHSFPHDIIYDETIVCVYSKQGTENDCIWCNQFGIEEDITRPDFSDSESEGEIESETEDDEIEWGSNESTSDDDLSDCSMNDFIDDE